MKHFISSVCLSDEWTPLSRLITRILERLSDICKEAPRKLEEESKTEFNAALEEDVSALKPR